MVEKDWCLDKAVEITKEHARGGGVPTPLMLENLYNKLKELSEDANDKE